VVFSLIEYLRFTGDHYQVDDSRILITLEDRTISGHFADAGISHFKAGSDTLDVLLGVKLQDSTS